ncbi:MAG TPA: hypothetical protein VF669_16540 [Tepidisphaeraceae bacterium]|jgi:hypothetical protein
MGWRLVAAATLLLVGAGITQAQTDERLVVDPWPDKQWGQTFDHLLYQEQGHVRGEPGSQSNTQMFWWDSYGRFRFSSTDPNAFSLAYRYVTVNFDSRSPSLPDTLDKVSLAAGLHLGEFQGGRVGLVLGAGWSGDNPFGDVDGMFGLAHLTWEKALNDRDALVLSIDWDGGAAFLPDVPTPGFMYVHREDHGSFGVGYPRSFVRWDITDRLSAEAEYRVPYAIDAYLDYKIAGGFSVFGNVANWFEAFYLNDQPREDRFFQQMARAEVGVRYVNPNVFMGMSLDAALSVGYAFEQNFYRGFDVRDLDKTAEISDEPYVALILRGTF